ncbi:MAG: acyloxyacyl hydrolase [Gammaproteobacteria bacterium]
MARRSLALALTAICMAGTIARADPVNLGYYSVTATRNFDDLNQHALSIGLPLRWNAVAGLNPELTITGGVLEQQRDRRGFISVGLTLEFHPSGARWFADAGFAPTYVGHADYAEGERLGAPFQFTTHVELGRALGKRRIHSIAIRLQHTSNGGFREPNPGVDMIGIAYHRLLGHRSGA